MVPPGRCVDAATDADLVATVTAADAAGEPLLLVGGGSNLLVADAGFPGTVVRIGTRGVDVRARRTPGRVRVRVAAGEPWEAFVATAVESGWSGVEALSGIPGSTGATPIQNVGAYGAEVAQVIESLEVLDRRTGAVSRMDPGRGGVRLPELGAQARGRALGRPLGDPRPRRGPAGGADPLRGAGRAARGRRRGPGARDRGPRRPCWSCAGARAWSSTPADHDTWSAGSFFTNPIISAAEADALPADAPRFAQPDGSVKTSAAWLITHAGFARGFAVRPGAPASLSTKHSLALTNRGGATAEDLLELARVVRAGVADRFGIVLENEPVLVGCAL